jgi:hypothetical protein
MKSHERRQANNTALRHQIDALKKLGEQSQRLIEEVEKEVISAARNGELHHLPEPLVAQRLSNNFKAQRALLGQAELLVKGIAPSLLSNEERQALMDDDTTYNLSKKNND